MSDLVKLLRETRAQALEDAADEGWKAMLAVASRKQMVPGADDFRDWLRARAMAERAKE